MFENPLHLLMNPKSIAVVGANNIPTKMGTIQALSILKDGYQGKVFPIHPKEKNVLGLKTYTSPEDLPEVPDLAVLIVPIKSVIPLIESFGKIGTKRAIIITGGFRETGEAGQKMENELNETANLYGLRFVGPNCLGIFNSQISLNTTVFTISREPGFMGFASQSGTYVTQAVPALKKRGFRFSKALSLGNEANINMVDALEYLGEDEQTKAIILYIEGIRDGKRFVEVARKITPRKPVIAQYVGGSASGARAGKSHTGAMAGPDFLYNGIFKQAGIIRVDSVEDLYANGWTMATQPPLKGNRVGIMTNSGGPSTTISYVCDSLGLTVPRFSDDLQKEIRKHIEPHASAANPVDLTFDVSIKKLAITLPEIIAKSGEVDAIVIHGVMMTGYMREIYPHMKEMAGNISLEEFLKFAKPVVNEVFELPRKYNMPFLISSFFDEEDCYTKGYMDNNVPVFRFPEKAAIALGCLYRYKQIRERMPHQEVVLPEINKSAMEIIRHAQKNNHKALNEYEAKKLLACYGVPITKEELAATIEETVAAAAKIGYPVALKACSWKIMHKSGKGLIALNVENETQLKKEFENIQKNAGKAVLVLVQEMLKGSREFLAGMTRFAGFGPCVIFGLGGVFTEVFKDTSLRLAPVADTDVQEMFAEIKANKLLDEFRGMPKVKTDKLSQIIQAVGNIALLHPEIAEIDLNPIIINGTEPVVADALIVLESK
ncbi:MAG: acetate--CoA ligase family protein [Syntrophaceae bacterium]|nr:acetate--CoA ligase family protein [Syntrophaceae bacterium]